MIIEILVLFGLDFLTRKVLIILIHVFAKCNRRSIWKKIKDKDVIVTGATGDIGREICRQLSKKNVNLILLGRNQEKLQELCDELSVNCRCINYVVDMNRVNNNFSFVDHHNVGLLINVAGTIAEGPCSFMEQDDEQLILTNILSTVNLTKRVLRKMINERVGYVVNIGSLVSDVPVPFLSGYAASKAYLQSWSYSLYYEMKNYDLHIEYVTLACVDTKMSQYYTVPYISVSPESFAYALINTIGVNYYCFPLNFHLILYFIISYIPNAFLGRMVYKYNEAFYIRAKYERNAMRSDSSFEEEEEKKNR